MRRNIRRLTRDQLLQMSDDEIEAAIPSEWAGFFPGKDVLFLEDQVEPVGFYLVDGMFWSFTDAKILHGY